MNGYLIGLDIGGTNLRIGAMNPDGTLTAFRKLPTQTILPGEAPCARMAAFLRQYISAELHDAPVLGVVLGFPSTVSADHRKILQSPNIPGLNDLNIADQLEKALGFPVYLERDVNLLLYQDMDQLQLSSEGFCTGIYVGTGIGNALFFNGRPYGGRHGVAGELGHMPVIGNSQVCGCGNIGCTECVASGRALEALGAAQFPDTPIHDLFMQHAEHPALQAFADRIACVIAAEVNLLDPNWLVLGGGVLSMPGFPMALLRRQILTHTRKPCPAEDLHLYESSGQPENGVRGALICAQIQYGSGKNNMQ